MSVEFIGYISNNNSSETIVRSGPILDPTHIETVAKAHELAPKLPLFAGGRSFGGRMTSQAQAATRDYVLTLDAPEVPFGLALTYDQWIFLLTLFVLVLLTLVGVFLLVQSRNAIEVTGVDGKSVPAALAAYDQRGPGMRPALISLRITTSSRGLAAAGFDRVAPSDGAFYLWIDLRGHPRLGAEPDSEALAASWLADLGVAATPGIDFDPVDGSSFLRLSFAGSETDMAEAVSRIIRWAD